MLKASAWLHPVALGLQMRRAALRGAGHLNSCFTDLASSPSPSYPTETIALWMNFPFNQTELPPTWKYFRFIKILKMLFSSTQNSPVE